MARVTAFDGPAADVPQDSPGVPARTLAGTYRVHGWDVEMHVEGRYSIVSPDGSTSLTIADDADPVTHGDVRRAQDPCEVRTPSAGTGCQSRSVCWECGRCYVCQCRCVYVPRPEGSLA